MKEQHHIVFALALLVLGRTCQPSCQALELELPSVGTDVGYNFHIENPVFVIGERVLSDEAIQARVMFTDGKHLRTSAEIAPFLFGVDIEFRAPGIAALFDPIFTSFDETLSLLGEGGAPLATAENSGVSYYAEDGDEYGFRWGFHVASNVRFYGFEWTITPDLIEGAKLPETLSLHSIVWGGGAILVIPEPTGARLSLLLFSLIFCEGRRVRRNSNGGGEGADLGGMHVPAYGACRSFARIASRRCDSSISKPRFTGR